MVPSVCVLCLRWYGAGQEGRPTVGAMSDNEFDYVTFRRKAECVRSAVRCALSESSKNCAHPHEQSEERKDRAP